jgi:hypothetical protein
MIQVNSPVEHFFDTDGTSLDDGYIYVGASGQNPETNPQPLYWDQTGLIPAAQPIRTRNGYPYRDGATSKFYTDTADYSITVRNKRGELVISVLNTASGIFDELEDEAGAALIGFDNTASGLAADTVQEAIDELVTDIEAVADDVAELQIGPNLVDNAFFGKYRRGEGTVGYDPSLTAGQFVVDRWKAGSGGCALAGTGTSPLPSTIQINSGTIVQQIRGSFNTFLENDTVVLGWDGGTEARIAGGAWSTSPLVADFSVGSTTDPEIEFRIGTDGFLSNPRLRVGSVDYPISAKDRPNPDSEYEYLSRYYQEVTYDRQFTSSAAETDRTVLSFPPMISVPTVTVLSTPTNVNVTSFTPTALNKTQVRCLLVANAAAATGRVSVLALDTGY